MYFAQSIVKQIAFKGCIERKLYFWCLWEQLGIVFSLPESFWRHLRPVLVRLAAFLEPLETALKAFYTHLLTPNKNKLHLDSHHSWVSIRFLNVDRRSDASHTHTHTHTRTLTPTHTCTQQDSSFTLHLCRRFVTIHSSNTPDIPSFRLGL